MYSLTEAMGVTANWAFVPGNVISAQDDNQSMLQARAAIINTNPAILTTSKDNKDTASTLQAMNRDVFLSGNRDRETGEAVLNSLYDSIEDIPKNLKSAIKGTGEAIGSGLNEAFPWWLIALVGLALVAAIFYFVSPLLRRA